MATLVTGCLCPLQAPTSRSVHAALHMLRRLASFLWTQQPRLLKEDLIKRTRGSKRTLYHNGGDCRLRGRKQNWHLTWTGTWVFFFFFAVFVFHIPLFKCLLNSFLKGQTHHVAETTLESEILLPQQGLQESGRDRVLSPLLFILAPELAIHFLPLYSYIISRGLSELMWGTMTTVCHHGVATVRRHMTSYPRWSGLSGGLGSQ